MFRGCGSGLQNVNSEQQPHKKESDHRNHHVADPLAHGPGFGTICFRAFCHTHLYLRSEDAAPHPARCNCFHRTRETPPLRRLHPCSLFCPAECPRVGSVKATRSLAGVSGFEPPVSRSRTERSTGRPSGGAAVFTRRVLQSRTPPQCVAWTQEWGQVYEAQPADSAICMLSSLRPPQLVPRRISRTCRCTHVCRRWLRCGPSRYETTPRCEVSSAR